MPEGPVIVSGMPLIAVINAGRDYEGEYWADVDELYWRRRDGTRGKHVSAKIMDKLEPEHCAIIEQVWDHLAYEQYMRDCALTEAPLLYQGGVKDNETIDGLFRFD